MKVALSLVVLLVVSLIINACGDKRDDLEHFIFKDYELPDGCRLKTVEKDELPFGAQSNPYLSSDRQFLDNFAKKMFRDEESLVAATRTALFSVYWSDNEIGIFGFQFNSEESAQKAANFLNTDIRGDNACYSEGKVVIFLWNDGAYNPYSKIKELVKTRLRNLK